PGRSLGDSGSSAAACARFSSTNQRGSASDALRAAVDLRNVRRSTLDDRVVMEKFLPKMTGRLWFRHKNRRAVRDGGRLPADSRKPCDFPASIHASELNALPLDVIFFDPFEHKRGMTGLEELH